MKKPLISSLNLRYGRPDAEMALAGIPEMDCQWENIMQPM